MLRSRNTDLGSSLVAWWLGFWAFTAQVQSLGRELRLCNRHGVTKHKYKTHRPRGHLLRTEPTGFSVGWSKEEGENEASKKTLWLWPEHLEAWTCTFLRWGRPGKEGNRELELSSGFCDLRCLLTSKGKCQVGSWIHGSGGQWNFFFLFNIYLYKTI